MGFGVSSPVLTRSTITVLRSVTSSPRQYLSPFEACVGDWIVHYEPRKVAETRRYFVIARVERVVPDPAAPGMFLALIAPAPISTLPPSVRSRADQPVG